MTGASGLDLLLVNPGGSKLAYQGLSADLAAKEPPIWAGLLAEYTRRRGYGVEILDANALDLSFSETAAVTAERRPRLVVVVVYGHNPNASTQVMPAAREVCTEIRSTWPEAKILLLGGHVAALPERTLTEECVDFVCDGEGTTTIPDLLDALSGGGASDLLKVRGLVHRVNGHVERNTSAPLCTDLSTEMPGVAWDLLPMDRYRAHNWHCFGGLDRQPYAAIYTTLGCPFRCSFCCIQAPFKAGEKAMGYKPNVNSYRRWSPAQIVAQIDGLVREHGITNFKFADEIFLLHKPHVEAICDGLIALGHDLNIWVYARIDTCTDRELLAKMRRAGVRWVALGIESASARVRSDVDKGYKPHLLLETIAAIQEAGIFVLGNYIFGLPEDDLDSMQMTLEFAMEANTEYANFYSAMAYPGSSLYREAQTHGWELPADWAGYSQFAEGCTPLPTRYLTGPQVLSFRDAAFRAYFDRAEYRTMFERTFGPAAWSEVETMLAKPVQRDLVASPVS